MTPFCLPLILERPKKRLPQAGQRFDAGDAASTDVAFGENR